MEEQNPLRDDIPPRRITGEEETIHETDCSIGSWTKDNDADGTLYRSKDDDRVRINPEDLLSEGEEITDHMIHRPSTRNVTAVPEIDHEIDPQIEMGEVYPDRSRVDETSKRSQGDASAPMDESTEVLCFTRYPSYSFKEFFGVDEVVRVGVPGFPTYDYGSFKTIVSFAGKFSEITMTYL